MQAIEARVRSETGAALPEPRPVDADLPQTRGSLQEIWSKRYRARTILLTVFHVLQPIGYYGFAGWVPTLLLAEGITVTQSLRYTFIIALASPLGPLLGWRFADVFERKWQVAGAALAIAAFGLLFALQRTALGVVLFGVLITLSSNWMSFAYHTYQSELYPTRIRARAVGFVYSWSRLSTVFSSFVIALFLRNYGTGRRVHVYSLQHANGVSADRRIRPPHRAPPSRRDRALTRPRGAGALRKERREMRLTHPPSSRSTPSIGLVRVAKAIPFCA